MSDSAPPKLRNARACEACRASKSRCFFKDNEQTVCQKCEQIGYPCVVRSKARPMRSRAVRPSGSLNKSISPRIDDAEFSLSLPATPDPNSIKEVKELHEHHQYVFVDEDSDLKNVRSDEPTRLIEQRKLNLQQAEHLLDGYRRKAVYFPFVRITLETVPELSRSAPFLLLAILTAASASDQALRHQMDQEFRRILSVNVVVDGQKSLDYLQGLLVYIAWYPLHAKPKNNQAFMYVNLALSLALDLGLDKDEIPSTDFSSINREGLIENGAFTQAAKRAYLGAYYISAASVSTCPKLIAVPKLSLGFSKPNNLEYPNLMDSHGNSWLNSESQDDITSLVVIQRLLEKNAVFHKNRQTEPVNFSWNVSSELNIQIFLNELDEWRRKTPDEVRNMPYIGLLERTAAIAIYSYAIGFLQRPYRDHVTEVAKNANQAHLNSCLEACKRFFEYLLAMPVSNYPDFGTLQWSLLVQATLVLSRLTFIMASTRGWDSDTARAHCPLGMYLDALCYRLQALSVTPSSGTSAPRNPDIICVFKMILASVKKGYERRVAMIIPEPVSAEGGSGISKGHCPILDPGLKGYWDNGNSSYSSSWETGMGSTPSGEVGEMSGVINHFGMPIGCPMTTPGAPLYYDLWATMTGSWAEET